MRSKWKANWLILDEDISSLKSRNFLIPEIWVGKRIGGYNGLSFVSMLIKDYMVGYKIGEIILTKKLGSEIHVDKKKKKK